MTTKNSYRRYTAGRSSSSIDLLFDADEYYQDVLDALSKIDAPQMFISAWVLHPQIAMSSSTDFLGMVTTTLKKPNSRCLILWNAKIPGVGPGALVKNLDAFRASVAKGLPTGVKIDDKLKVIFSGNFEHDLEGFFKETLSSFTRWFVPTSALTPAETMNKMKEFLASPSASKTLKNLNAATLASHHQKTVVVLGTSGGSPALVGWCGGIDFGTGPAGITAATGICAGGRWWHDAAARVRQDAALGLLANFVERWNFELGRFDDIFARGVVKTDTLASETTMFPKTNAPTQKVETDRTMPLGGTDFPLFGRTRESKIRERYLDLIGSAKNWIYIENQYFRYPGITQKIVDQLAAKPALHVTIVIPSYSEELARDDLPKLRRQFVGAKTAADRAAMLKLVIAKAPTVDPINKLTLLLQTKQLRRLIAHPRVSMWIPEQVMGAKVYTHPYVHTKLMAVDDTAITVGSANTNPRSMDAKVDTEINLTILDTATVQALKAVAGWTNEPKSEASTKPPETIAYAGTYYAAHKLIRYTADHLTVDEEFAKFPIGRTALLDWFDKLKKLRDDHHITFTRAQLKDVLDKAAVNKSNLTFDIDTDDMGEKLLPVAMDVL